MKLLPLKSNNDLLIYVKALVAASIFWFFESLVKSDFNPGISWLDSIFPKDPVELWFRLLVGSVIVALMIDYQGRGRRVRQLEERLNSGQGEA